MRKFLAIIFIFHCASAASLLATTRTVTNLNDAGAGSLRQRILESAANDTINFSVTGTITLTTAELLINKNLTISGPGAAVLTVRRSTAGGTPQFRIFDIANGFTVTISGLAVANGNAPNSYQGGGGILNDGGTLAVAGCTISGNSASGSSRGGGVSNSGGTLNITHSTISGNTSGNDGGGISNYGTLTITNSIVSDNTASFYGGGISNSNASGTVTVASCTISGNAASSTTSSTEGGGIFNGNGAVTITDSTISANASRGNYGGGISNYGTLTITNSIVSDNTASWAGGGIKTGNGTVTITNSTVSGNEATNDAGGGISLTGGTVNLGNTAVSGNSATDGGGIANQGDGTLNLTNSTISANSVSGNSSVVGGGIWNTSTANLTNCTVSGNSCLSNPYGNTGGGIYNQSGSTVTVKNTIIAKNTSLYGPDIGGALASYGFNLIGDNSDSTISPAAGDQIGTPGAPIDPLLDQLADNGGPTKTQALLSGSPAINNGDPNAPSRDQRGYIRPDTADIGAFEFGARVPVKLANISTRAVVQTGNNVLIAGIIITGGSQKSVIVRALGPTLGQPPFNLPGVLADPTIELRDSTGALITANDNWSDAPNNQAITDSGYAPPNSLESAVLTTLNPGNYTAIVRGVNNGTGIALVEVYDLDDPTTASKLGNISTRAFVQTGGNVMIAGVIVHGPDTENVIIRGLGPTLGQPPFNLPNALQDSTLELRDTNGNLIGFNDNWRDTQQMQIQASGYAPPNNLEAAILATLTPSNYTAILRGKNNTTGNALVEVYSLN